ncbi:MAG: formylglycine-generating enzyme family protein [bacterium]|nr:formylglycine-generating enzyme family protein [bacterium]
MLNFAQMIFNTLDVVLSMPITGIGGLVTNLGNLQLDLNATDISNIGLAISEGDVKTLITEIIDLTLDNVDNIALWLWQSSTIPENISQYTSKLLPLLKNVALPLKVLGAANKVPFFYDLVAAPKEVTYDITQSGGVLDLYTPSGNAGETTTVTLTGSTTMDFVYIAPGTFTMGSPGSEPGHGSDEGPQHEVTISQGFHLGKYEVTQGQWEAVMGTTPWSGGSYVQEKPDNPAVYVSWNDAQEFVHRLNVATGDSLYRLPSEAEWEYACRAGITTRWSFGDNENQLKDYAWYDDNAWAIGEKYAHQVGTKKANPWGLYDMHGNVWEWVQDWYGSYSSSAQVDPMGPVSGSIRVWRGGSFDYDARLTRSADRSNFSPSYRHNDLGFRLLRRAK